MESVANLTRYVEGYSPFILRVARAVTEVAVYKGYNLKWLRILLAQYDKPTRENDTMRDIEAHDYQPSEVAKQQMIDKVQNINQPIDELEKRVELRKEEEKVKEEKRKREEMLRLREEGEKTETDRIQVGMKHSTRGCRAVGRGRAVRGRKLQGTLNVRGMEKEGERVTEEKRSHTEVPKLREESGKAGVGRMEAVVYSDFEKWRIQERARELQAELKLREKEEEQKGVKVERKKEEEILKVREKEKADTGMTRTARKSDFERWRIAESRRSSGNVLGLAPENTEKTKVIVKTKIAEEGRKFEEVKIIKRQLKQKTQSFSEEMRASEETEGGYKQRIQMIGNEGSVPGLQAGGKVMGAGEQETSTQEVKRTECATQPIVWPSRKEIQNAKQKTQYNPENFAFAVAGTSGSGKSSLINVFLNSNAAPTGIVETTADIRRYPDPGNKPPRKGTVWYDVPGAGTLTIPGWQYFNSQGLFVFDLIIVVIGDRFTEIDFHLLENCKRCNIPSFIVRSKADQHIRNMMKESGYESDDGNDKDLRERCRTEFIAQTRQSINDQLKNRNMPQQKVYIVSASKEFKQAYSSLEIDTELVKDVEGIDKKGRFIDEFQLIFDLLATSRMRRCDTTLGYPISGQPMLTMYQNPLLVKRCRQKEEKEEKEPPKTQLRATALEFRPGYLTRY